MKTNIFRLLIFVFVFCRCEKPIDVDLNSSDPKIVIEGVISDAPGEYNVKLSRSVNFDESNEFPVVSGALVKLSDDEGNTEELTESSAGVYSVTGLGVPGRTYTLQVIDEGKVYTAISKMPLPVKIDSVIIENRPSDSFDGKVASVRFQDPAGIENYYRLSQVSKRGRLLNIIIDDDRLQDGRAITISTPIMSNEGKTPGDSVTVVLQSIDKNVYEYLRMLEELRQEGSVRQSALDANPVSNFSNGALGYFSANSRSVKTIVVR